jgi:hypothetical protein
MARPLVSALHRSLDHHGIQRRSCACQKTGRWDAKRERVPQIRECQFNGIRNFLVVVLRTKLPSGLEMLLGRQKRRCRACR